MPRQMTDKREAAQPRTVAQVPWVWSLVAPAVFLSVACGGWLDVTVPSQVTEGVLNDPKVLPTLVPGVVADFECAFTNYALLGGAVADELMNAGAGADWTPWDRRQVTSDFAPLGTGTCASGTGLYTPLSTARFDADDVYRRLQGFSDADIPSRASLMATVAAYGGYALTLLGEGFCQTAIDGGPALSPAEVLDTAVDRFTKAIQNAQAANNTEILNMAYVGRARARLGLGALAEAKADAQQVPQGYRKDATYSAVNARRENKLYTFTYRNPNASVDPSFWNLTWDGVPDPRVSLTLTGLKGLDGLTPLVQPKRYATVSAPIPIATWEEAQLIIAEVDGGQAAVGIINNLLQRAGLNPDFSASTDAEIKAGIIEQRRRQLFLQSQRLGDMLRYNLPFPSGVHPYRGLEYGTSTCFPLPDAERFNNPNIQ